MSEKVENENVVKSQKINPSKVENGDVMAFLYYAKVQSTSMGGGLLNVLGLDNNQGNFKVEGAELVKNAFSADRYETEEKINQTDMIDILTVSYNRPFTVVYEKDEDKSERTLRGRLIKPDLRRGRSMVEDLDQPDGKRVRLVDHRTLKSLIVDGVKYTLKRK